MIDNKNVLHATFESLHENLDDALELSKEVAKINANIEKLLNAKTIDRDDLESEYTSLITSHKGNGLYSRTSRWCKIASYLTFWECCTKGDGYSRLQSH